jgi:uncharacterized protein (TIGR02466 family)
MLTLWFPTAIFDAEYPQHQELKHILEPLVLSHVGKNPTTQDWIGNVPNSFNLWNPLTADSQQVQAFAKWVEEQTNELAFKMGSMNQFAIGEAWANVYGKGDFQESHYHPGWHFSAVYFLTAPEGSGSLKFESPLMPDMMPLDIMTHNEISNQSTSYKPIEGSLVIFRSSLRHGVYPNQSDQPRISLAMNLCKVRR